MKADLFIARRIAFDDRASNSRWIIRIAIIAIALCITVMIVASALIRGFKSEISDKIYGFWGHINITSNQVKTTQDDTPIQIDSLLLDDLSRVDQVAYYKDRTLLGYHLGGDPIEDETNGGVHQVQPYVLLPGIIKDKNLLEGIVVKGVDDAFDWDRFERFIVEGSSEPFRDTSVARNRSMLISKTTANRLDLAVNDRMIIHFLRNNKPIKRGFRVSGIYDTKLEEYDRKFAIADMDELRPVLGYAKDQVSGLEVFVDDPEEVSAIRNHLWTDILPADQFPNTIREKDPEIFEWLELQNYNEVVILTLMILVSIINMITSILILILERTNMIGILKALGQTNWGIRKIFLYQAGIIVGKGLVIGNAIGLAICLLQKYTSFIKLDETEYYLSVAPIEINFWLILLLNIGTLVIILVALIIPSYFISNISPIKAIRFK